MKISVCWLGNNQHWQQKMVNSFLSVCCHDTISLNTVLEVASQRNISKFSSKYWPGLHLYFSMLANCQSCCCTMPANYLGRYFSITKNDKLLNEASFVSLIIEPMWLTLDPSFWISNSWRMTQNLVFHKNSGLLDTYSQYWNLVN